MFFKLGVDALMLDNKGNTLIESLFAFAIYVTIVVIFVGLLSKGIEIEKRLSKSIINSKEVYISQQDTLENTIKEALR